MSATGVWVAYDPEKKQDPIIETGAEAALWAAVDRGQRVVFWPFGKTLQEAIDANVTKGSRRQEQTAKPSAKVVTP